MHYNSDALGTASSSNSSSITDAEQERLDQTTSLLIKICALIGEFFGSEALQNNHLTILRSLIPSADPERHEADLLVLKEEQDSTIPDLLNFLFETCLTNVRELTQALPSNIQHIQATFNPTNLSACEIHFSELNKWKKQQKTEQLKQNYADLLLQVIQDSTKNYLNHHGDRGMGYKHGKRGVEKVKVLQQRGQNEIHPEQTSLFIARLHLLVDFYNDRLKNENDAVMPGGTSNPHNHSYISFLANELKSTSLLTSILSDPAQPPCTLKEDQDYTSKDRKEHASLKQTRQRLSRFFKHLDVDNIEAQLNVPR